MADECRKAGRIAERGRTEKRVESPSEVERLCDALGVGYYGVGVLQWPGGGSGLPGLEHIAAWVAVLGYALLVAGAASPSLSDRAPERAVSPSVETLVRQGDPVNAWLERLDAAAQAMRSGSIYRGAAMSGRELRDTLDNHDADPALRAAAARVLVRVAPHEARSRVEAALATLRDASDRRRRLLAEADEASLEALEALEEAAAREAAAARRAK
ncbi:MAG TPA: hypothetical protein VFS43_32540 [Polyangiaceae bacterium]|nr:hypothetical protein [Polyangiaceae bacterium]